MIFRRAISKLQSTAELQAQMKPFSFTEREEKYGNLKKIGCSRLCKSNPQLSIMTPSLEDDALRESRFRARPVPKNLFSNYIYEKMKEDDFYRYHSILCMVFIADYVQNCF
jgi:protein FAM161A